MKNKKGSDKVMGRTIPSFRILLDIEKSSWSSFRKYLNRNDRKTFDILFYIPKLYCHSLSNLSKSIIIESILMINLFYSFKILKIMLKALTTKTEPITIKENKSDLYKQKTKTEFYIVKLSQIRQQGKEGEVKYGENDKGSDNNNKLVKDWNKFLDCLAKEDKNVFIEMINDCYKNYNKSIDESIKEKGTNSCITRSISLFMALILYQQKQINLIKSNQRFID
jgi:hypothetical protein